MINFSEIKSRVDIRDAAERYGLRLRRGDMTCCTFHSDKTPSMKLYSDHFYCFGCQKSGDVIDLAAGLFGLSNSEAAKKLATDFGIRSDISVPATRPQIPYEQTRQFREDEQECYLALLGYLKLLERWERELAPKPDSMPDPRFNEACQMKGYVEYICDTFITGSTAERVAAIHDLKPHISELQDYTAKKLKEEKSIERNKRIHTDLAV